MLGGSAVHFSLAASFFTDVRVVGPVGDDFGADELCGARGRGVNTDDIERVTGGKTFFWRGHYEYDLNTAHTDDTQLNVFGEFAPKLSEASRDCDVALPGQHPARPPARGARAVREAPASSRMDSMNLWIDTARDSLVKTIEGVDGLLLNDAELRQLTGEANLVRAAREAMSLGPAARRGQAGRVRRRAVHRRRVLRPAGLPAGGRARPDRRRRLLRRRLRRLPGRAPATRRSTPTCCAARWPTARRWPRSTSRSSGPSGCARLTLG